MPSCELRNHSINMRYTGFALAAWAYFADFAVGLVLVRKEDPPDVAMTKMVETEKAKEYMGKWRPKAWDKAGKSCDTDGLPATTDTIIFNICGADAMDGDKCVCNLAKAHSCHTGCKKASQVCPKECKAATCTWGAPDNGGSELSEGGSKGVCHKYCSPMMGPTRYCGEGPAYMSGSFLDCKGCDPANALENMSPHQQKIAWTSCMAGCYPTPTCAEMCGEGTPECYTKCVDQYSHVVEPYWDMFKGSLKAVPLLAKHQPESVVFKTEPEYVPPPPPEALEPGMVPSKALEALEPKKKEVIDEEYEEGEYDDDFSEDEGEEEWKPQWDDEDDNMVEGDWGDDDYEDYDDYGDEEYGYEFHALGVRVVSANTTNDTQKDVAQPIGLSVGLREVKGNVSADTTSLTRHNKTAGRKRLRGKKRSGGAAHGKKRKRKHKHKRKRRRHKQGGGSSKRLRKEDPWKFYAKAGGKE